MSVAISQNSSNMPTATPLRDSCITGQTPAANNDDLVKEILRADVMSMDNEEDDHNAAREARNLQLAKTADAHLSQTSISHLNQHHSISNASSSDIHPAKRPKLAEGLQNKRLFGVLAGTLVQFKEKSKIKSEADQRRDEIQARLQLKLKQEREQAEAQNMKEKEEREARFAAMKVHFEQLHALQPKVSTLRAILRKANFLKTQTSPPLFFLPATLTDEQASYISDRVLQAKEEYDNASTECNRLREICKFKKSTSSLPGETTIDTEIKEEIHDENKIGDDRAMEVDKIHAHLSEDQKGQDDMTLNGDEETEEVEKELRAEDEEQEDEVAITPRRSLRTRR